MEGFYKENKPLIYLYFYKSHNIMYFLQKSRPIIADGFSFIAIK